MNQPEQPGVPHRRLNLLTGEWVLVSPQRTERPWQGQLEPISVAQLPAYDPQCYLCPGNVRAGGAQNPAYTHTFVFINDYAALLPEPPAAPPAAPGMLRAMSERGLCRVICFSPQHNATLADMRPEAVQAVVDLWADQTRELGVIDWVRSVQIFENRGAMMGSSNPHPHGQIWANEQLPNEILKERLKQEDYLHAHGRCLLCDYLALELELGERVVLASTDWVAVVPFWAVWPFETLVLPRQHATALPDVAPAARADLASLLQRLTRGYNALFQAPFPYTMGLHQAPTDGAAHPGWHLHIHFYPPLLRSASVRKFMVGYEMLAQPQRDITPEQAAARLREQLG